MRSIDIKEGGIYRIVAWKYRDTAPRSQCYAKVLAGPLPGAARGRYEFEVRFLTGPFSGQIRRLTPNIIEDVNPMAPGSDSLMQLLKAVDGAMADTEEEASPRADVELVAVRDKLGLTLTEDTVKLLPDILKLIASKQAETLNA